MVSRQRQLDSLRWVSRSFLPIAVLAGLSWFEAAKAEITAPPILYDHLSDEESEPYVIFGNPPTAVEDIRAAKRWPSAVSCLASSEKTKGIPELQNFDWPRMRNKADIEVCMFRIFSSYETPVKASIWFEQQGLQDVRQRNYEGRSQRLIRVISFNRPDRSGKVFVPSAGIRSFLKKFLVYGETFAVIWAEDGTIYATQYEASSL